MKTKHCHSCGETKPLEDFPLGCLRADGTRYGCGRTSRCKACHAARYRNWRATWTPEQRASVSSREKAYRDGRPHAKRAKWANLHAKRVGAVGILHANDVSECWESNGGKCWVCGDVANALDHYRPLNGKSGGTNTPDNIRPICRECNQKRSHQWHGEEIATKEAKLLRQLKRMLI